MAVTREVQVPDVERDAAERLVHAAHQPCPYSNATRGKVEVQLVGV